MARTYCRWHESSCSHRCTFARACPRRRLAILPKGNVLLFHNVKCRNIKKKSVRARETSRSAHLADVMKSTSRSGPPKARQVVLFAPGTCETVQRTVH